MSAADASDPTGAKPPAGVDPPPIAGDLWVVHREMARRYDSSLPKGAKNRMLQNPKKVPLDKHRPNLALSVTPSRAPRAVFFAESRTNHPVEDEYFAKQWLEDWSDWIVDAAQGRAQLDEDSYFFFHPERLHRGFRADGLEYQDEHGAGRWMGSLTRSDSEQAERRTSVTLGGAEHAVKIAWALSKALPDSRESALWHELVQRLRRRGNPANPARMRRGAARG